MKDTGKTIRQLARAVSSTPMEMSTMGIGKKIKLMGMVFTLISMVQATVETGSRISNMEMVLKHGLTVQAMMVDINKVKSMEKVNLLGQMAALTTATSMIIILRARASITGLTGVHTTANGRIIRWKDMVLSIGLMVVVMKVSM